jgi:HSP20 family protein
MTEELRTTTTLEKNAPASVQPAETKRGLSTFEEMERLFDTLWPRNWMMPWQWDRSLFDLARVDMHLPKVDVIDRDSEVLVKAEMPGITKEDLHVSVNETSVTITGETSHEEKEEKGDYFRREMRRGTFSRTVALPCSVDGTQAKAQFKDGVLELTLPKIEQSKRISVKIE